MRILFLILAAAALSTSAAAQERKPSITAPAGTVIIDSEAIGQRDKLPDVSEYDDVPAGRFVPPQTGVAAQEYNPDLMPRMPGVYKIPGMDEFSTTSTGTLSMSDLMAAYKKKEYTLVLQYLPHLAEGGNHEAEELLGVMYLNGHGVERSEGKALHWLTQAAEANQALAQHYLGVMYFTGMGMEHPNSIEALKWVLIAIVHYPPGPEQDRAKQDRDNMYVKLTRLEKTRAREAAYEWLDRRGEAHLLELVQ